jgi:hypothetical protein
MGGAGAQLVHRVHPPLSLTFSCYISCHHLLWYKNHNPTLCAWWHIIIARGAGGIPGWLFLFAVLMAAALLFTMVFFVSLSLDMMSHLICYLYCLRPGMPPVIPAAPMPASNDIQLLWPPHAPVMSF